MIQNIINNIITNSMYYLSIVFVLILFVEIIIKHDWIDNNPLLFFIITVLVGIVLGLSFYSIIAYK